MDMTAEMIEMVRLGREVVDDGRLKTLRERLGFSRSMMSELFHVTPVTYTRWEHATGAKLRILVAEKLGRFYRQTAVIMDELEQTGVDVKNLIPIHLVAAAAGVPQELLLSRYREGDFEAVDLGILGLWLHREDLAQLGVDDK